MSLDSIVQELSSLSENDLVTLNGVIINELKHKRLEKSQAARNLFQKGDRVSFVMFLQTVNVLIKKELSTKSSGHVRRSKLGPSCGQFLSTCCRQCRESYEKVFSIRST